MNEPLLQIAALLRGIEESLAKADWREPPVGQTRFQDVSTLVGLAVKIAAAAERNGGSQGGGDEHN